MVGGMLVVVGVFALVNSIIGIDLAGYIWALILGLAGLAFIFVLSTDKRSWWASFPGFTLLGIGAGIAAAELFPRFSDVLTSALTLGGIGVSFLVVYLLNRSFWWAIIPMGVMLSIVALIVLEPVMSNSVVFFFLGLAATFGSLALLPINNGKRPSWPLYPGGAMLLVAFIVGLGSTGWTQFIMPAALILGGGYLVFRAVHARA